MSGIETELRDALAELVEAIERRWGGETAKRRANAVSPRMEEAILAGRAALAKARGQVSLPSLEGER